MKPDLPESRKLLASLAPERLVEEPIEEGLFSYSYRPRLDGGDAPLLPLISRLSLPPLRYEVKGVGARAMVISGLVECLQVLLFRDFGLRAERVEISDKDARSDARSEDLILTPRSRRPDGSYGLLYSIRASSLSLEPYVGFAPVLAPSEAGLEVAADPLVWAALPRLRNLQLEVTSVLGSRGRLPVVSAAALVEAKQSLRADLQGEMSRLRSSGVFSFPLRAREEMALRREVTLMRELCQAFALEEVFLSADAAFAFLRALPLAPDLPDLGDTAACWLRGAMDRVKRGEVPVVCLTGPWAENVATSENIARLHGAALRAYQAASWAAKGLLPDQLEGLKSRLSARADLSVLLPVFEAKEALLLREEIGSLFASSPYYQRYSRLEEIESRYKPWAVQLGSFWFAPESLVDESVAREIAPDYEARAEAVRLSQKAENDFSSSKTSARKTQRSPARGKSESKEKEKEKENLTLWGQYWLSTRGEVSSYALLPGAEGASLCSAGCPGQCPLLSPGGCESGSCALPVAKAKAEAGSGSGRKRSSRAVTGDS